MIELYTADDVNKMRDQIGCDSDTWVFIDVDPEWDSFFNGHADVYDGTIKVWSKRTGTTVKYDCEISEEALAYYRRSDEDAPGVCKRLRLV